MNESLIVLGVDTDVGKTTFSLLWLAAYCEEYAYWKPLETGPSDTERLRALPGVRVHPPIARFEEPVAPPLAAARVGQSISSADDMIKSLPPGRLLIETFGSPFSPLNDRELQWHWIRKLQTPSVLVTSTTLGAIGRTLQTLAALDALGLAPAAVVMIGTADAYARREIAKHSNGIAVFHLEPPTSWDADGIRAAARTQLDDIRLSLSSEPAAQARNAATLAGAAGPELLRRDRAAVWHPYTPLQGPNPLVCVGAQDEFLQLADGRRIIDAISSWWTILFGHRDPVLLDALTAASRQIDHVMFAGITHPWGVELAELLLRSLGWTGGRVFYSDNGSTAVEVALKLAYQWCRLKGEPGRTRFVGFEHGYHGDTFGAMAVGRDPLFFGAFEPLLFKADILPLDPNRLAEHLRKRGQETAAVILEPLVQGAGGMRMHSPETLAQIAAACRDHGVLFIADEVMTGGGRTGTLWAHQQASIVPDLVCAAKTIAGGMLPLAVTVVAQHLVSPFLSQDASRTFFHGHSFTAHPLACALGVANFRRLLKEFPKEPLRMQNFWEKRLAPLRAHPQVKDVRIQGSIAAVELAGEAGYLAGVGRKIRARALEHGVLLRPLGSVAYAMPPFATSDDSLQRIAAALETACDLVE